MNRLAGKRVVMVGGVAGGAGAATRILAPIVGVRRKKDIEAERDITKQNERMLLGFRNAYVFDRPMVSSCRRWRAWQETQARTSSA